MPFPGHARDRELVVAFGPLAKGLISADRETVVLNTELCWIDAVALLAPEVAENAHRSELASICSGSTLPASGDKRAIPGAVRIFRKPATRRWSA